MRVVIAMDSFKQCLSAEAVSLLVRDGLQAVFPDWDYDIVPIADGGEGTVAALVAASGGRLIAQPVTGPSGDCVASYFGLSGDGACAFIEVAAACGLGLVGDTDRGSLHATSYGVGELIRTALDRGVRRFIIGLGGSGTNDGGAGLVQALGVGLFDAQGAPIRPGGGGLAALDRIDLSHLDPRIGEADFAVACDVDNVLAGPQGASVVFGPQKGATPAMVEQLDANLQHYARLIQRHLGIDIAALPGGGAAGGIGAGLVAFLGARLTPGAAVITGALGLDGWIADADLVITGEGRLDGQSIHGKAPLGVAAIAGRHGKPVIALAGSLGEGSELAYDYGIDAMFGAVSRCCTIAEAVQDAADNIRAAARNLALALRIGISLGSIGAGAATSRRDQL